MPDRWITLSQEECKLLIKALRDLKKTDRERAGKLMAKLLYSEPHPKITVGVHGGQVQWVLGNPFPVRVCDYDGDRADLPDIDERGQECRIWFEPVDTQIRPSS